MAVDLSTNICGVEFRNPFILSSATPTKTARNIKRGLEAGWAGAVMKTLVPYDYARRYPRPRFKIYWLKDQGGYPKTIPRSFSITDIEEGSHLTPEEYVEEIDEAKRLAGDAVIIGSITAPDMETWEKYIELMNGSRADMVELNFSCPYAGEPGTGREGEKLGWQLMYTAEEVIRLAKRKCAVPFSPKISSQTGEVDEWAARFEGAGAPCLTLSHRISSIDIDIETGKPIPFGCIIGFGGPYLIGFSLKWIAKAAPKVKVPIIACMGMLDWSDAVKFIMVGASSVESCSAVMVQGYDIVKSWLTGLRRFMLDKGYSSIEDMRGISLPHIITPSMVERENEGVYAVVDKEKCTGCGICKRCCFYFAIDIEGGKASVDLEKCDGCGLCQEVCPEDAVKAEKLFDKDIYPRPDSGKKPYNKLF
ncbi:4Fe-4S binding protein [Candidatus Bathyarchaeota archaeon]|nr:4Fe-4S binding protein [Candidatus Bathyarchaeota archaeon]MBS7628489.1 4Fe-4S binding protein [Candidatus Bathyarchaeota archaeon]